MLYHMDARGLAKKLILEIINSTGITATAGVGTNLYLCKVAMDIVAKHIPQDKDWVRVAYLDEMRYRRELWDHKPLTDFWRVGPGIAKKLAHRGIFTMGELARLSLQPGPYGCDSLYQLFGVNAELLIDHAWGYEPCTIAQIKAYRPSSRSVSSGQVLSEPYSFEKARLVVREMADQMAMDLVSKGLVTKKLTLTLGYDRESLKNAGYTGAVDTDRYGRQVPKSAHGTIDLECKCASSRLTLSAELFSRESAARERESMEQMDLFSEPSEIEARQEALEREQQRLEAMLKIKERFGKNAIFRGMNLEEGAKTVERNRQIGGHKK